MRDNEIRPSSGVGGITALEALQIVFIVLKLCHVIDWSWWLVLIPSWISLGLFVGLMAIIIIFVIRGNK